jgi:hypothetical protein
MSASVRGLVVLGALAAIITVPARAQQGGDAKTYDLRGDYKYVAGDKVRVHERSRTRAQYALKAGAEVLQKVDQTDGYEQRYEEEVQAVDERGNITKSVRTYVSIEDFATAEKLDFAQKPIKVQMDRAEDGTYRFTAMEGATVPPALQQILDQDAGSKESEAEDEGAQRLIMPEGQVAVGAQWTVTNENACQVFQLEPTDLAAEGTKAEGRLEAAEPAGDLTMLSVNLLFDLKLSKYSGMDCREPMALHATLALRMPAGAGSPDGEATMEGSIRGTAQIPPDEGMPPGSILELDMTMTNVKKVERVR